MGDLDLPDSINEFLYEKKKRVTIFPNESYIYTNENIYNVETFI